MGIKVLSCSLHFPYGNYIGHCYGLSHLYLHYIWGIEKYEHPECDPMP